MECLNRFHLISLQRYNKKCICARKASIFFENIDLSIEYVAHSHVRSLLMGVKSEWHIHEAKPYFQKQCERSGTYAALCDCTFEEGPALREVPSKFNKITIVSFNARAQPA